MDRGLFDEFGNYIGPELDSSEDDEENYESEQQDATEYNEEIMEQVRQEYPQGPQYPQYPQGPQYPVSYPPHYPQYAPENQLGPSYREAHHMPHFPPYPPMYPASPEFHRHAFPGGVFQHTTDTFGTAGPFSEYTPIPVVNQYPGPPAFPQQLDYDRWMDHHMFYRSRERLTPREIVTRNYREPADDEDDDDDYDEDEEDDSEDVEEISNNVEENEPPPEAETPQASTKKVSPMQENLYGRTASVNKPHIPTVDVAVDTSDMRKNDSWSQVPVNLRIMSSVFQDIIKKMKVPSQCKGKGKSFKKTGRYRINVVFTPFANPSGHTLQHTTTIQELPLNTTPTCESHTADGSATQTVKPSTSGFPRTSSNPEDCHSQEQQNAAVSQASTSVPSKRKDKGISKAMTGHDAGIKRINVVPTPFTSPSEHPQHHTPITHRGTMYSAAGSAVGSATQFVMPSTSGFPRTSNYPEDCLTQEPQNDSVGQASTSVPPKRKGKGISMAMTGHGARIKRNYVVPTPFTSPSEHPQHHTQSQELPLNMMQTSESCTADGSAIHTVMPSTSGFPRTSNYPAMRGQRRPGCADYGSIMSFPSMQQQPVKVRMTSYSEELQKQIDERKRRLEILKHKAHEQEQKMARRIEETRLKILEEYENEEKKINKMKEEFQRQQERVRQLEEFQRRIEAQLRRAPEIKAPPPVPEKSPPPIVQERSNSLPIPAVRTKVLLEKAVETAPQEDCLTQEPQNDSVGQASTSEIEIIYERSLIPKNLLSRRSEDCLTQVPQRSSSGVTNDIEFVWEKTAIQKRHRSRKSTPKCLKRRREERTEQERTEQERGQERPATSQESTQQQNVERFDDGAFTRWRTNKDHDYSS